MPQIKTSPTYNLGAVLRETGLKADTLRAWERRYNLPQPSRSEGGQRLYSQRDLEIIKWLIARQEEGLRISQAAKLWRNRIENGVDPIEEDAPLETRSVALSLDGDNVAEYRSQWLSACLAFDEARAEQVVVQAFSQYPPEIVCFDVLFAGLSDIGEAWYQGQASVQQEHFASALVARRLNALIAGSPPPTRAERIAIAAPANEEHYLSALLIAFLLRRRGWDVVYLGADVPIENFRTTISDLQPELVLLTAHQLATATSLLEMANALDGLSTKLAFGGLIFNRIPRLRDRTPGYFLGDNLKDVIANIEQFLQNPRESLTAPAQTSSPLLKQFQLMEQTIENRINEIFIDQPQMRSITRGYFSKEIIAALKLGDITFLSIDLDWVHVFLSNFNISTQMLLSFLQTYYQVLDDVMGSSGAAILDWLQDEMSRLAEKESSKG